ncbi:MAG: metal transporter [Desulfobacteraceae bacterium]
MYNTNEFHPCTNLEESVQSVSAWTKTVADQFNAAQSFFTGVLKYNNEFLLPFLTATGYFTNVELSRAMKGPDLEQFDSYMDLLEFNGDLLSRYFSGSIGAVNEYSERELKNGVAAWNNTLFGLEGEKINDYIARQAETLRNLAIAYPQAISDIEPEYGFHFERGENPEIAETDRFILYQIMPDEQNVTVDDQCKPLLIIPPFVLGTNILAFLPKSRRSYAHAFANKGIPTYIRIMRDISTTPAFQTMTAEEDALDTRFFCEKIKEKHKQMVTLNGYCQGGYTAVCNILSGKLDNVVDALVTCVSPMDGTKSRGLSSFLKALPPRFNDLIYGTKQLPNGNKVADGDLMGWIYRLKSIENEAPMVSFFRDLLMVTPKKKGEAFKVSKTAAALNYWLQKERSDLPLAITEMSFASYNTPITEEGILPVKLFGKELDLKRINEKKIPWLICYGEKDDLVEKETSLAPLDYVDAEIAPFPKGHVAIATSWSHPDTEYALDKRFGANGRHRGPVRFQLDLNET